MNCCCNYGCAVAGEWPEFGCFACPIHRGELASLEELCKRHKKQRLESGVINTDDGRTLQYEYHADEQQASARIIRTQEQGASV